MKLIAMFKRRPDLTLDQFREYYETRHSVMSAKIFPFMKDYRRNYILRDMGARAAGGAPATTDLGFDVVTEITFESRAGYEQMLRVLSDPATAKMVADDEAQFMDRSATLVYFVDEHRSQMPAPAAA